MNPKRPDFSALSDRGALPFAEAADLMGLSKDELSIAVNLRQVPAVRIGDETVIPIASLRRVFDALGND